MKKGFTLIEMLGVIVILSLLTLVTYTGVNTMNRKYKVKEFEDYKNTLCMSAQTYISRESIHVEDEFNIQVNELMVKGYIDKVIENPETEKEEYEARIKVTKDQAGVLNCEYVNE